MKNTMQIYSIYVLQHNFIAYFFASLELFNNNNPPFNARRTSLRYSFSESGSVGVIVSFVGTICLLITVNTFVDNCQQIC
ncbi:hypothetical protein M2133_002432 [Parabacteroides sp. PF5-6]|nr:hypothetical protein [Parabacteroides sp. PF5-6]